MGTGTLVAIGGCGNISEKNRAKLLYVYLQHLTSFFFVAPLLPLNWVVAVQWQKDII